MYFVRHGEANYDVVRERGAKGWSSSFAPLSERGRLQIDAIAGDYRLQEASALLTSSYARALESAARLSRLLDKELFVEYDLHEWLPHRDSLVEFSAELLEAARVDMRKQLAGAEPAGTNAWESVNDVRERTLKVLSRYVHLQSVVVVTHAVVINAVTGLNRNIENAEIVPFEFDPRAAMEHGPLAV